MKDDETLLRAYDDSEGITARFTLNLLHRFNRELGADFDPEGFQHLAIWNAEAERVEIYLQSLRRQTVQLGDEEIQFHAGEKVLAEYSQKVHPRVVRPAGRRSGMPRGDGVDRRAGLVQRSVLGARPLGPLTPALSPRGEGVSGRLFQAACVLASGLTVACIYDISRRRRETTARMTTISTRDLSGLSNLEGTQNVMRSLAMLDVVLCPEWEFRYFSFNDDWEPGEKLGLMRNGEGDDWLLFFNLQGAILKGFQHDAPMAENKPWPGLFDSVPDAFDKFLADPAFTRQQTTFCAWLLDEEEDGWRRSETIEFPSGDDPDGSAKLMRFLDRPSGHLQGVGRRVLRRAGRPGRRAADLRSGAAASEPDPCAQSRRPSRDRTRGSARHRLSARLIEPRHGKAFASMWTHVHPPRPALESPPMIPSLFDSAASSTSLVRADLARFGRRIFLGAFVSAAFFAGSATAQDTTSATHEVTVWAEVLDNRGFTPEPLASEDLEVVATGGVVRRVRLPNVSLRRPDTTGGVRWLVYVDQPLSSPGTVRRAMDSLGEVTSDLTGLGEVEIVSASTDEAPDEVLRTGDPLISAERFSRMALTERGQASIRTIRERALEEWIESGIGAEPRVAEDRAAIAIAAVDEEIDLVRERLRQMVGFLGRLPIEPGRPRVVLPVLDGFDLDPVNYWATVLDDTGLRLLRESQEGRPGLSDELTELSRALAASGWIAMPLVLERPRGPEAAELTGVQSADPDRNEVLPGVTVRPGQIFGKDDEDEEEGESVTVEFLDPRQPLERLAQASGGEVLVTDAGLRGAVDRFADRIAVSWSSPVTYEDDVREVVMRSTRPGWQVTARSWIARGVPEAISALRLDQVLGGREDEGDLSLAAVLEVRDAATLASSDATEETAPTPATLDARLDLGDLEGQEGLESVDLQVTVRSVGLDRSDRSVLLREVVAGQNLTRGREWRWRRDVELPPDATAGRRAHRRTRPAAAGAAAGRPSWRPRAASAATSCPRRRWSRCAGPSRRCCAAGCKLRDRGLGFTGRAGRASCSTTARWRAGEAGAVRRRGIDLGRTPAPARADGRRLRLGGHVELGRDSAVVNGGSGGPRGRDRPPARPPRRRLGGGGGRGRGAASSGELDRVLFFWNNSQVATVYGAPFKPAGVRRRGQARSGLRAGGGAARRRHAGRGRRLHERPPTRRAVGGQPGGALRGGGPTRPAGRCADSARRSSGCARTAVPQDIATFRDASDLPLTLGMAIDSSASMFVKLPQVQSAASKFLRPDLLRAAIGPFVVDFDSRAAAGAATTQRLDRLVAPIWTPRGERPHGACGSRSSTRWCSSRGCAAARR